MTMGRRCIRGSIHGLLALAFQAATGPLHAQDVIELPA